jgi:hypothetical protein
VHHRDLSITNMMYHEVDGNVIGIMTDFDLTVLLEAPDNQTSQKPTGTAPFMAIRLQVGTDKLQSLNHDFESALYILMWVGCGYKDRMRPHKDPLRDWKRGDWERIAGAKSVFLLFPNEYLGHNTGDYELLSEPIERLARKTAQKLIHKSVGDEAYWTSEEFFRCLDSRPPSHDE